MEGRGLAVGDDVGGLLLLRNGLVDLNTVGVDLDGALDDDNVARENGDVVVQIRLLCRGGDVDGLIRVGLQRRRSSRGKKPHCEEKANAEFLD